MARISLRRKRNGGAPAAPQAQGAQGAPPPPPPGQPGQPGQPALTAPQGQPSQPGEPVHPGQTSLGGTPAAPGQTAVRGIQGAPGHSALRAPAGPAPTSPPVTKGKIPPPGAPSTVPPRPTLEGLRAWIATLDRRVGIRTYLGVAAVILALAASAVAIVLAIDARDNSASNDDLNAIAEKVNGLDGTSSSGLDATAIEARLTALEDQLSSADGSPTGGGADAAQRLDVLENDIEELRSQIDDLKSADSSP